LGILAGCGGSQSPAPENPEATPQGAIRAFMQAVADSNITRMTELWGSENGPASMTRKPEDYQRRMVITQLYLRNAPYKILREDPVTGDPKRRIVTVDLDRRDCTKTVPVTVVSVGKTWIVNQVDLNQAGAPVRPCQPSSSTSP
jgi:hypothetical protein